MSIDSEKSYVGSRNIFKVLLKTLRGYVNEFLPTACSLCLKNIDLQKYPRNICDKCFSEISLRNISSNLFLLQDPVAKKFNFKSLDLRLNRYNTSYSNNLNGFYIFICTYYDSHLRNMIRKLKFYEGLEFVPILADLIYLTLERAKRNSSPKYERIFNFDCIVPIPLHNRRFYERGYNQIELVARELSRIMEKNLLDSLARVKQTKRQSEMNSKTERLNNMVNAFSCINPTDIIGKRILLIDDVVSSGQTLWEAGKVLRENGAEVLMLAIAGNQKENYT